MKKETSIIEEGTIEIKGPLSPHEIVRKVINTFIDAKVDVLLKVIKWMFIMEDIVYWNYPGRSMLYNALKEV